MAGPQLSDPKFKQFTEATAPDTSVADALVPLSNAVVTGVEAHQSSKLREEVQKERNKFLETAALGSETADDPVATTGQDDFLSLDVNAIRQQEIDAESVTVNAREIAAMDAELQSRKRQVEQGLAPTRALEISVEQITRRYIDRFPGLATQFQAVAQRTLGTENNLLTATMRSFEEAERLAAQQTRDQFDTLNKAAFDGGYTDAVFGATEEIRARARVAFLANQVRVQTLAGLKQQHEMAVLRGEPTVAQRKLNEVIANVSRQTMLDVGANISAVMPDRLQGGGLIGFESNLASLQAGEMEQVVFNLENQKALQLEKIRQQIAENVNLDEVSRQRMGQLTETVAAVYDNVIESVGLGRFSEQTKHAMDILQHTSQIEFEQAFGRDALFLKNIVGVLPPGNNNANRLVNTTIDDGFIAKVMEFYDKAPLPGIVSDATPSEIQLTHKAQVAAFKEAIDPKSNALGKEAYNTSAGIRGMNVQFHDMPTGSKRELLNMVGTDEFRTFLRTTPLHQEDVAALNDLEDKVSRFGIVMTERAANELQREVTEPKLARLFNIKRDTDATFKPLPKGEKPAGPLLTGSLVNVSNSKDGIVFTRKSTAELRALGIDTSPETMENVDRLVRTMNSNLASNLNSIAGAQANLNPNLDKQTLIANVLSELIPEEEDAEVREE